MKYLDLKKLLNTKPNFVVDCYNNNIIHVHCKNSKELSSTFLRFQEFYESPYFKGKKINLWNFYNYYQKFSKKAKFTYCSDWSGFNLPYWVFTKFKDTPLPREKELISILPKKKPFYVIGTCGRKNSQDYKDVLLHEKAHALYFLNPQYKKEINKIIDLKDFSILIKYLKKLGYNEEVILDEVQAYMLADYKYLMKKKLVNNKDHKEYYQKIIKAYKKNKGS
jgi:hypothetical protein